MSGGSYAYAYCKVDDFIGDLRSRSMSPERQRFAALLERVSRAMHDIEWVDSYDYGQGDELKAIAACFDAPIFAPETPAPETTEPTDIVRAMRRTAELAREHSGVVRWEMVTEWADQVDALKTEHTRLRTALEQIRDFAQGSHPSAATMYCFTVASGALASPEHQA